MLAQERFLLILQRIAEKDTVTIKELMDHLNTSESTIRRDLVHLNKIGKLKKIHGGATKITEYISEEMPFTQKEDIAKNEKEKIAQFAASLVMDNELIYIDAGTTTNMMVNFLQNQRATFVTNGLSHAQKLSSMGFRCFVVGGELKNTTKAVVGSLAMLNLKDYNFSKGFFGTNGISLKTGFTTPDIVEAAIKKQALLQCKEAFILSDSSKFDVEYAVTFGDLNRCSIITDKLTNKKYNNLTKIIEV